LSIQSVSSMARIVKESSLRRNEILDVSQRLVFTKGYEQMTIQDILDELQISKGAFYHYFESKGALLEALVERMAQEGMRMLLPIVEDPNLLALEKLQRFYNTAGRWKTDRKTFILELLRVWYTDENAIVRQKEVAAAVKEVLPLLTRIVRQGVEEGTFKTSYPDQVGEVVLSLVTSVSDTMGGVLLSDEPAEIQLSRLESMATVYTDALERVLGAPRGSITLVDSELLKEWVVSPEEIITANG
jgi:AcrR family transcriptional regulator